MKFTFKTEKPKGKWKSFSECSYNIKLNGKLVGNIEPKKPHYIRLMVIKTDINEDGNPNCDWKWIKLVKTSDTVDEAKEFLNKAIETIIDRYNLKLIEY